MRKRMVIGVLGGVGVLVCFGAVVLFNGTPSVPRPWGVVKFTGSTSNRATRQATFHFTSHFPWPVMNEIAWEGKTTNGWPDRSATGGPLYTPPSLPIARGGTSTFSVNFPTSGAAWRILIRSTKANISPAEERRLRLSEWLGSHGMDEIANRISTEDAARYVLPGPEMRE